MDNIEFIEDVKVYQVIEKIVEGCSKDEKYKFGKDGKYFWKKL